jgi:hypothetical protein
MICDSWSKGPCSQKKKRKDADEEEDPNGPGPLNDGSVTYVQN